PTGDGSATHHTENTFCLAGGKGIVCQGPDLRGCQHSKDAHPNVKNREQPDQVVVMAERPEKCTIGSEEQLAAHQQSAQGEVSPQVNITGHDEAHEHSNGN